MRWLDAARGVGLRQFYNELLHPTRTIAAPAADEQPINSPLFATLVDRLRAAEPCRVFDLGPAVGANVAYFGSLHCRIQIADCRAALLELNAAEPDAGEGYAEALRQMLPLNDQPPCDAILAWDILNYLDKPLLGALMKHLAAVVSGDTWLHAYIGSRREMPAEPQRYRLDDSGRVIVSSATATIPCPCYPQPELRRLMPALQVSRSMLLQNGVQEYLFRGEGRGHRGAKR